MASTGEDQFNGRWDITVKGENVPRAWWLEISGAGTENAKGKFVGAPGAQIDDIRSLSLYDGELRFTLEKRYRHDPRPSPRDQKAVQKGLYYARIDQGKLKGTFEVAGEPDTYLEWIGVRAPVINEKDDGTWKRGEAVNLFDGKDLAGWSQLGTSRTPWVIKQGILTGGPGAPDLTSDRKFWNFTLHAEFRIGPGATSGIGLRGRYEVHIADDIGRPPSVFGNGAVYGRIAPVINASREPGDWQTFDIRLVGRQVTVLVNGVKVVDRQTIEGLTATAIDANEGDPGPIVIQGDHGTVEFRRIVISPLTKTP